MRRTVIGRSNAGHFRRVFAEERPDIVVVWSLLRLSIGCARAAEQSGVPVVYMAHDDHLRSYMPAAWRADARGLVRYVTDRTLFRPTTLRALELRRVVTISHSVQQTLLERGVPLRDARVVYQAVPSGTFPPKAIPGALRPVPRLLYVGQLHPYKGAHTLVDAFRLLVARRGRGAAHLTIVGAGDPDYERYLREQAPADVRFAGRIDHEALPPIYREHDLFVFPSIWKEPFGLTHLEAMASGTTVVSTTQGGPGEFLADGENALTFPKEDPQALCAALERLLDDPALSRRLAGRARQQVLEQFSLDRYLNELERYYREVVGAPART